MTRNSPNFVCKHHGPGIVSLVQHGHAKALQYGMQAWANCRKEPGALSCVPAPAPATVAIVAVACKLW